MSPGKSFGSSLTLRNASQTSFAKRTIVGLLLLGTVSAPVAWSQQAPDVSKGAAPAKSKENEAPKKDESSKKEPGEAIDMQRAYGYFQRRNRGEKLTPEETAYLDRALEERRRRGQDGGRPQAPPQPPREQTGLKPLSEMTADDRYKDMDGGLYGAGKNTPPEGHRQASLKEAAKIVPLDAAGKPAENGKIALISMSMSNTTQEFSAFVDRARNFAGKSPKVTLVDCAQGGQVMARWADPQGQCWNVAMERLARAEITPEQVQAVWLKPANAGPRDSESYLRDLHRDTAAVLRLAKQRFPNLRIVYLSSRTFAGLATGGLNPEPYAYESAFVVRSLIQDQIKGDPTFNFDSTKGAVAMPLLLWGPYLWTDGTKPRAGDGLVWLREDLAPDGVHPSHLGQRKVAGMLLEFFQTHETAKPWFVRP